MNIEYPQFSSGLHSTPVGKLNLYIQAYSDSICNDFIRDVDERFHENQASNGTISSVCNGGYEIGKGSESVVSVLLSNSFSFPGEEDLNMRNALFLNYDLATAKFLEPEDCFQLVVPVEEWTAFVMEKHDLYLKPKYAIPRNFLLSEGGVDFFFKGAETAQGFTWDEVERFFGEEGLLPFK